MNGHNKLEYLSQADFSSLVNVCEDGWSFQVLHSKEGPRLDHKHSTGLEKLTCNQHSSLMGPFVSDKKNCDEYAPWVSRLNAPIFLKSVPFDVFW
jgi:hypothetical protein